MAECAKAKQQFGMGLWVQNKIQHSHFSLSLFCLAAQWCVLQGLRSTHKAQLNHSPEGCNLILLLFLKCHSGDFLWQLRSLRGFFKKNPSFFVGPDAFTELPAASAPASAVHSITCLRHLEMSSCPFSESMTQLGLIPFTRTLKRGGVYKNRVKGHLQPSGQAEHLDVFTAPRPKQMRTINTQSSSQL